MRNKLILLLPLSLLFLYFFSSSEKKLENLLSEPVNVLYITNSYHLGGNGIIGSVAYGPLPNTENIETNKTIREEEYSPNKIMISSPNLSYDKFVFLIALQHRGLYSLKLKTELSKKNDMSSRRWVKEKGLLKRRVSFDSKATREVTGIDPRGKFLTHKHDILYRKKDGKWYTLLHNLSRSTYFTSVYSTKHYLYIGTSTNGLYRAKLKPQNLIQNIKINFKRFSAGLFFIPHSKNIRFYEEIQSIHETRQGALFVGTSIQGRLYVKPLKAHRFRQIQIPFDWGAMLDLVEITSSVSGKKLWISTSHGLLVLTKQGNSYITQLIAKDKIFASGQYENIKILFCQSRKNPSLFFWLKAKSSLLEKKKQQRINKAKGKRLFYSSSVDWNKKKSLIKNFFQKKFYNGIVVDVKDDQGYIRYNSKVNFVKKTGALRPRFNLQKLIHLAHSYNQWIVARIVVFKDAVLFKIPGYAIRDKRTRRPWVGKPRERWIDPFNQNLAQNYYIPLIQELETMNVDEVQLDYIRLPSDGAVWNATFLHQKGEDIYHSEALESFLYAIRKATSLPIALDIYGYSGLYRAPGVIGQDIEAYGRHADIISPMLYSSHFGNEYMRKFPKSERTFRLIYHSIIRAKHLANNKFLVRPWLQGFAMKTSIWGYGKKYFQDQMEGIRKGGMQGFMFWGSIQDMQRVVE